MHHEYASGGDELDGKISIAHGIERVQRDLLESQQLGSQLSINWISSPGKCGGTQGRNVDSFPTILEALVVTIDHLEPRH